MASANEVAFLEERTDKIAYVATLFALFQAFLLCPYSSSAIKNRYSVPILIIIHEIRDPFYF
jgi:hypothetical protein